MMRVIVGAITGIFMALYFMYFVYPLLSTEHTAINSIVNATDPTIVSANNLGSGFYLVIPLIPILIAGFFIINVALKRDPGE